MSNRNLKTILFLKEATAKTSNAAFLQARKLNLLVLSSSNHNAIEVSGPLKSIDRLFKSGLFSLRTNKVIDKRTLSSLKGAQQKIAHRWNYRFSKLYSTRKTAFLENGKMAMKEEEMPSFFSPIDPDEFVHRVKQIGRAKKLKFRDQSVKELSELRGIKWEKGVRRLIVSYLKKKMGRNFHFYFSGIIYAMTHGSIPCFLQDPEWDPVLREALNDLLNPESCRKLHGRISIGLIFVNSSLPGGPVINPANQSMLETDIMEGLDWLVTEHPSGNLSFAYDVQVASIAVEDQDVSEDGPSSSFDSYWRNPGIGALGFTPDSQGVEAYKNSLINADGSDDAVVFFISQFGSSWHAYSSGERFISLTQFNHDWSNGVRDFSGTAPHELLHQFGAADEYDASVATCDGNCDERFGCDQIPNGNCVTCAHPFRSCVMEYSFYQKICQYTRGQVGWSDIFVELTTDDELSSGTRNNVFLDIGHKTFRLDYPNKRDRKRNYKEGYAIWDDGSMNRNEIKRILIRKEDGNDGWKLKQVKVFHGGDIICDESPEKWIKDYEQFHLACDLGTGRQIVHKLELRVKTADVANAGTDGRVTLTLANREWRIKSNTNDFGRGLNQVYNLDPTTGLRIADLTQLFISKTPSTIGGRWKLAELELIVNDMTIYENNNINEWLDNSNLNYSETLNPPVSI